MITLPFSGVMTEYLVYLGLGKLVIFMVQTAGILEPVWSLLRTLEMRCRRHFAFWPAEHDLVDEFRECGFCVGSWVFPILAFCGKIYMFNFISGPIGYILTGFFSSFVVHLLDGGWKYHFNE